MQGIEDNGFRRLAFFEHCAGKRADRGTVFLHPHSMLTWNRKRHIQTDGQIQRVPREALRSEYHVLLRVP